MTSKLKKAFTYTTSFIVLVAVFIFASMEDYQEDRMAEFLCNVLSLSQ